MFHGKKFKYKASEAFICSTITFQLPRYFKATFFLSIYSTVYILKHSALKSFTDTGIKIHSSPELSGEYLFCLQPKLASTPVILVM